MDAQVAVDVRALVRETQEMELDNPDYDLDDYKYAYCVLLTAINAMKKSTPKSSFLKWVIAEKARIRWCIKHYGEDDEDEKGR